METDADLIEDHAVLIQSEIANVANQLHVLLEAGFSRADIVWFVVDLEGVFGGFAGREIMGQQGVERRVRQRKAEGLPPSFSFPLDFPDAQILLLSGVAPQLIPDLVAAHSVDGERMPTVVVDHLGRATLGWVGVVADEQGAS